jgi:hypothetical protein
MERIERLIRLSDKLYARGKDNLGHKVSSAAIRLIQQTEKCRYSEAFSKFLKFEYEKNV